MNCLFGCIHCVRDIPILTAESSRDVCEITREVSVHLLNSDFSVPSFSLLRHTFELIEFEINFRIDFMRGNLLALDPQQESMILKAIRLGSLSAVSHLQRNRILEAFPQREFLVHKAAFWGHVRLLQFFHENGWSLNSPDQYGGLPIHYAAHFGRVAAVQFLAEKQIPLSSRDVNGITPIHHAALNNHLSVIILLESLGIPIDEESADQSNAAHYAAKGNSIRVLKYLSFKGIDLHKKNHRNQSPLSIARHLKHSNAIAFLESTTSYS